MRFYTAAECEGWLKQRERNLPGLTEGPKREFPYPAKPEGICYTARWIAGRLTYRMPALLSVTEWGIWPGSENWHLYYRLRHSYGDQRLLAEAPGHLFLPHEAEDLASFLHLVMLFGWDGYLLTQANYVNLFFSHDEFVSFYAEEEANLFGVEEAFPARQSS